MFGTQIVYLLQRFSACVILSGCMVMRKIPGWTHEGRIRRGGPRQVRPYRPICPSMKAVSPPEGKPLM